MPHFVPPEQLRIRTGPKIINTMPRTIGIELEISDWKNLRNERFQHLQYEQTHDWSVQPSGMEMVISPLQGDVFINAMLELGEKLYRTRVETNHTCALHVHIGGQDLSYWELRRLLRVYARIEKEIYDYLILPHRRDVPTVVHYCQKLTERHETCNRCMRYDSQYPHQRRLVPLLQSILPQMDTARDTAALKRTFLTWMYGIDPSPRPQRGNPKYNIPGPYREFQTRKGGRYEWARYVGLNLHAWQYRGTLEFRMKEGTTDVEELLAWPLWCGWFVEAATRMKEKASHDPGLTLVPFTETYMPKWIAEWVKQKVAKGVTSHVNASDIVPNIPNQTEGISRAYEEIQRGRRNILLATTMDTTTTDPHWGPYSASEPPNPFEGDE